MSLISFTMFYFDCYGRYIELEQLVDKPTCNSRSPYIYIYVYLYTYIFMMVGKGNHPQTYSGGFGNIVICLILGIIINGLV
jgi:hypothetical protein